MLDTDPAPAPTRVGTMLLRGVVGSTAYGLAHSGSDQDYLGVFVAPTTTVLGLSGHQAVTSTQRTDDPDQALHELGKFMSLALKSNPTISELLWLNEYETMTEHGRELIGIRTAFLSRAAVLSAYGGYAHQQAKKLASRSEEGKSGFPNIPDRRTVKHGRHCMRLIVQARALLQTGHLHVDVGTMRDELFAAGELALNDPAGFAALFKAQMDLLNRTESILPETPDTDTVNDLLVDIRRAHLT